MFHPAISPHDPAIALVVCDMTGAYITHDGGRSWRMLNLRGVMRFFVFDPCLPSVIYAQNNNLWRSRDNGATWSLVWPPLKNTGIRQPKPFAWRVTLAPDRSLYRVVARRSEDGSTGNSGDGTIYGSSDGAESWHELPKPAGMNVSMGPCRGPLVPAAPLSFRMGPRRGMHGQGGGIYISEDAGQHWFSSLTSDQHVYDVTSEPRLPGTVYTCGFGSSA